MNAESNLITVPLSRLQLSPRNVRKTGGAEIQDLAASIAAHGLGQNLIITRNGGDVFEVEAGGRRLKALQQLAGAGTLPADWPVPCKVVTLEQAAEISLAENQLREQMHPADQFTAIKALVDSGLDEAEVAARFGVTRLFVRQRMKLAKVSPKILDDYRAGKTTLEMVEAFALTNDVPRQERVYKKYHGYHPTQIRRALTEGEVQASDDRVAFVGLDAYKAAGGAVHEDLFEEDAVYLRDPALLDRLVDEKFEAEAAKVRAEGWGWVEVGADLDEWRFGRNHAEKGDKSKCGALVTLDYRGQLVVHRWRMKPGQRAGSTPTAAAKAKPKDKSALSVDMTIRLEMHRAAAIREHVAANPVIALRLLLQELISFAHITNRAGFMDVNSSISAHDQHQHDGELAKSKFNDIAKSPARAALQSRLVKWQEVLKGDKQTRTADLVATLTTEQQLELLALCFALTLQRNAGKSGAELAQLLGVDMTKWWAPTADTFLSLVPKPVLAAAVTDVAGKPAGEQLLTLKKDAAIASAAEHLDGKGWLPKPLRGAGYALKTGDQGEKPKTKPTSARKAPAKKASGKSRGAAASKKAPAKKVTASKQASKGRTRASGAKR